MSLALQSLSLILTSNPSVSPTLLPKVFTIKDKNTIFIFQKQSSVILVVHSQGAVAEEGETGWMRWSKAGVTICP